MIGKFRHGVNNNIENNSSYDNSNNDNNNNNNNNNILIGHSTKSRCSLNKVPLKELFKIHVKVNLYSRKNYSLLSLEVHVKCLFLLSGGFRFGFLQR